MSFDLGIWFEAGPITDEQAAEKYLDLGDGAAPEHPRVVAFHRDLVERFPDLDDASGDEDVERSPWSAGLSTTPTSVVMTIRWSRAAEVSEFVRRLAGQHELIYHDPQSGETVLPDSVPTGPRLTLSSCDGSRWTDPAPERIATAVRRLSADNWFVILEGEDGWWIQAGYGEQAGGRSGWYVVEYREGSAERHFGATVSDIDQVIRGFQGYADGDELWRRRFVWKPVRL